MKKNGFLKYQLADRVNEALVKIGFHKPTAVQEEVIPLILGRRNLVVEAATGTGKTAAYGLPLLSRIDLTKRSTQVLVLAPSRELALQVEAALRSFTTHEKFRVASVYGGMSLVESERKIKSSPHVLVAVPGRLKDALRGGKLDHVWRDIKYLVIDEADKLLEAGFQEMLDNLVSHVRNMVQVMLFSATISKDVEMLIKERFHPVQVVRLSANEALKNITFHYIVVDQGQKQRYLAAVLKEQRVKQGLIFTPNRDEVYAIANFLRGMGYKAEAYHGLLDQVERAAVMKRFKAKQIHFLVATDLAARGLDVESLPAVINYAFPDELEIYLHRCGRTGRAGKRGTVYNLVASTKEQVLVESFHRELQIPLKGYMIEPLTKEAVQHVEDKQVKVHLNRGKRDKVSAGDVVGFLVNATGVPAHQIGTIAVYDNHTVADLPEWALEVLDLSAGDLKLKGKAVAATKFGLEDQKRKAEALRKRQFGVRDKAHQADRSERIAAKKRKKAGEEEQDSPQVAAVKAKAAASAGKATAKQGAKTAVKDAPKAKFSSKDTPKQAGSGKGASRPSGKDAPKAKPGTKAIAKAADARPKAGAGKAKPSGKPKAEAAAKPSRKPEAKRTRK